MFHLALVSHDHGQIGHTPHPTENTGSDGAIDALYFSTQRSKLATCSVDISVHPKGIDMSDVAGARSAGNPAAFAQPRNAVDPNVAARGKNILDKLHRPMGFTLVDKTPPPPPPKVQVAGRGTDLSTARPAGQKNSPPPLPPKPIAMSEGMRTMASSLETSKPTQNDDRVSIKSMSDFKMTMPDDNPLDILQSSAYKKSKEPEFETNLLFTADDDGVDRHDAVQPPAGEIGSSFFSNMFSRLAGRFSGSDSMRSLNSFLTRNTDSRASAMEVFEPLDAEIAENYTRAEARDINFNFHSNERQFGADHARVKDGDTPAEAPVNEPANRNRSPFRVVADNINWAAISVYVMLGGKTQ